jgi:hypothetical protein
MNKITEQEIQDYVSEVGDFEKEHRKGSSFYCTATHTFTQKDIDELAADDIDASDFLGVQVQLDGTWSDDWGTDWDDISYCKVEDYEEVVPEVIIPEHTVTKQRYAAFKPEFGDE